MTPAEHPGNASVLNPGWPDFRQFGYRLPFRHSVSLAASCASHSTSTPLIGATPCTPFSSSTSCRGPSRATPKLIRKYFSYDESEHTSHSVYLWESESDARAFFNNEFVTGFKAKFGAVPELFYVDTLMMIDNEAGKTTTS